MRERYCFFNVDGLLNRSSDWNKPFTINYELAKAFCFFLSSNSLIPVLSSSWRIGFNKANDEANAPYIKELEGIFSECGLKIHDKTPFLRGRTREKEIERFLYFNRPGKQVIDLLDVTEKKTVLIYEIIASLIKEMGIKGLSGEEIAREIRAWVGKILYENDHQEVTDPAKEFENRRSDRVAERMHVEEIPKGQASGKYDLASFMGNSKFSDITGGRV